MQQLTSKFTVMLVTLSAMSFFGGCASNQSPLPTPDYVDLERFMGRWYVHGYTPILVDKKAHNAVEHYRLDEDAKIRTTYQFRDGGFDTELKTYTPVGWVHDTTTNAEWRMQFIWPFRADYIILHVDDTYSETIIAHPNRKYAWIMSRRPEIAVADYERLLGRLRAVGYDLSVVQRLPQDWSDEGDRLEALQADGL